MISFLESIIKPNLFCYAVIRLSNRISYQLSVISYQLSVKCECHTFKRATIKDCPYHIQEFLPLSSIGF
ncbi:MAG: hypothetical protein DRR08_29720 [Candidatus Parabeggiatoa sp. nov. 2]|nr:MAG: hypothetical protein DRR08_29720 [Gammaproteobacteria bacterium]